MSDKRQLTKEELQNAINNLERQRDHMAGQVEVYNIQIEALQEKLKKAKE